jgi:hypothetical protein
MLVGIKEGICVDAEEQARQAEELKFLAWAQSNWAREMPTEPGEVMRLALDVTRDAQPFSQAVSDSEAVAQSWVDAGRTS